MFQQEMNRSNDHRRGDGEYYHREVADVDDMSEEPELELAKYDHLYPVSRT